MKKQTLNQAQDFLTVNYAGRTSRIVEINDLVRTHGSERVVQFLLDLLDSHKKRLNGMIRKDKRDPGINEEIATMFRIKMAIRTINKELKEARKTIQGVKLGIGFR